MRWSEYFIPTLKTIPKDLKSSPFKFLIKSGMLKVTKEQRYFYLPLGLKLIYKLDNFIRSTLHKHKGLEISLVNAAISSDQSIDKKKAEQQNILHFFSQLVTSYRQLPLLFYYFATKTEKFRKKDKGSSSGFNSRFMEAFWLKSETIKNLFEADKPSRIIKDIVVKLGLKTYEINLLKNIGKPAKWILYQQEGGDYEIAKCPSCDLLFHPAQVDFLPSKEIKKSLKELQLIETPGMVTVEDVCNFFKIKPQQILKTIILTADGNPLAILIRGDLQLSLKKLRHFLGKKNIQLANENLIREITGAPIGFSGPISLKKDILLIGDFSILSMVNFVAGSNRADFHYINVNLKRDFSVETFTDLCQPDSEELCPSCKGRIPSSKFSRIAEITFLYGMEEKPIIINGEKNKTKLTISHLKVDIVSLLICLIENYKDETGIAWPLPITPFEVIILPLNIHIKEIKNKAEELYSNLKKAGIETLLDDRSIGVGAKFSDAELLGIPLQIILGKIYLEKHLIEIKNRKTKKTMKTNLDNLETKLKDILKNYYSS